VLQDSLVVLDFETTGLSPERGDRVTEVGLVRIENSRITGRYQSLMNCGARVPGFITAYTGITQRMVDEAPPVEDVMREVAAFIDGTPVVAHNASFDQRFFLRECRGLDIAATVQPFICSMRISRRVYPEMESHSLGVLAHALQLRACGRAHRAAADAETTAELMLQLGRDILGMHAGIRITAALLRRLMLMPVAQVQTRLMKLCA
jgi:DNA polymerase-3 subunit epsilon